MTRICQLSLLAVLAAALAGCGAQPGTAAAQVDAQNLTEVQPEEEQPKPPRYPKPEHVRGIYLTAWSAGSQRKMDKMMELVKNTELNAVVIDVRDAGNVYWKTGIALADEVGASHNAVPDQDGLMQRLEDEGVYPIARISCFRDNFVPKKKPELAVQRSDGSFWKDHGGYTWIDPYNKKNWEYILEVVEFALDKGFPEIQLDYVRFPSEGKRSTMHFPAKASYPNPEHTETQVIAAFANFIGERVRARGAVFSADIFGIVSSGTSDQGIGQALEDISAPFDLICPMVYPSHYAKGEYGVKDPNRQPYEIVLKSLRDYTRRLPDKPLRPWLQDFSLFGVSYGVKEVQAQIKAAKECGYEEYLLWNARNVYTEAAIKDNSKLAKKRDFAAEEAAAKAKEDAAKAAKEAAKANQSN